MPIKRGNKKKAIKKSIKRKSRVVSRKRKQININKQKIKRVELILISFLTMFLLFFLTVINLPKGDIAGYAVFEDNNKYTKFETIKNYQQLFRGVIKEEGKVKEVNTTIATGEMASSEDVVSAVEIYNALAKIAYRRLNVDLDKKILDFDQNFILIGKYSDNFLIRNYIVYEDLPDNVAKIILLKNKKYYIMILTGDKNFFIRKAALVLANINNYNLDSREICVTGSPDKLEDIIVVNCDELIPVAQTLELNATNKTIEEPVNFSGGLYKVGEHELGNYKMDESWDHGKYYDRKCDNGKCILRLYQTEQYFTINGKLQDIRNALRKECDEPNFELCINSDDYRVKFKKSSIEDETVKLRKNNMDLAFKPISISYKINGQDTEIRTADDVVGKGKENRYEFQDIFGVGSKIEFIFRPSEFKEEIFFDDINLFPNINDSNVDFVDVNYKINLQENYSFFDDNAGISLMNLSEYLVNNSLILYKDSTAFVFTEPFIIDNQGENYPAKLIIKNKDSLYIGIRMNSKDLRDASYPIYIDPTIKLIGAGANITFDGFVSFSASYTRDGTSTTVDLGVTELDPVTTNRAVYEWNISLIPDGADVLDINFTFNVAQVGLDPNNRISFRPMADNSSIYSNDNKGNGLFYNDMGNGTNFTSFNLASTGFLSINLSRNESGSKDMELNLDAGKNWWGIGIHTPETASGQTTLLSTSEAAAANRPILTVLYDFVAPTVTLNLPFNNTNFTNIGNITLNSTVRDNENRTRLIKYYGSNETTPTGEFLLYELRNHENGTSTQYNWTAPVLTNERSAVLILHFNNQSEFGEFNDSFVRDFSSQGNNGTVSGASFNHIVGKLGGAFNFPGSGSNNISFGDQDELIGNDMSYVAWVNVTGTTSIGGIMSKLTGSTGFQIRRNKVGALASAEIFANSLNPVLIHRDFFVANQYVHLGVTIDSGGTIRLYRNGLLVNTTSSTGVTDNPVDFTIGSDGTDPLSGTIDEVGVYNRTLSSKEIRNLFRLPKGTYYWYVNASDRENITISNINTFNIINVGPTITRVDINTTDISKNDTNQNLTRTLFNVTDENDGDDIYNITDWRVNDTSIAVLNAPLDLRRIEGEGSVPNYASYGLNGSLPTGRTNFGQPAWSTDCIRGGCFQFNGSQRIDFNHSDIYNFFNENFTIILWFKLNETDTTLAAQPRLISKMTDAATNGWSVFYDNGTKKIGIGVGYLDSLVDTQLPDDPMVADRWYHLAWVWERKATTAISGVYINGTLSSTKTFTIAPTDNTLNLTLGMASASTGAQFKGVIDEILVLNRTFNSTQVAMWYKNRTDLITNDSLMGNQLWSVCVTPTDLENNGNRACSINTSIKVNNPPTVTTTTFEPTTRATITYTNDTLNCTFTIVDDQTGGLSANITFINWTLAFGPRFAEPTYNISITNGTSASQTFTAQAQQKNETWWCDVVPYDGNSFGNQVNSSNITIANSPPYVPLLFQPPDGNASSSIRTNFTWSVSNDEDMDAINYTLLIDCFNRTSGGNCPTNPANDFNVTFIGNSSTNQTLSFDLIYRSDDNLVYNWTVNATDGTNTSAFREFKRNFTIDSLVDLTFEALDDDLGVGGCTGGLNLNGINFGTQSPDTNDNTTDNSPNAFGIINSGNVVVDVNVTGTQLFTGTNPGYEFKSTNYSARSTGCSDEDFDPKFSAFNSSKTPIVFIPLNTTSVKAIGSFNYTGGSDGAGGAGGTTSKGDTVEVDINISIPSDEFGSTKSSVVNFTGYYRGIAEVNMP